MAMVNNGSIEPTVSESELELLEAMYLYVLTRMRTTPARFLRRSYREWREPIRLMAPSEIPISIRSEFAGRFDIARERLTILKHAADCRISELNAFRRKLNLMLTTLFVLTWMCYEVAGYCLGARQLLSPGSFETIFPAVLVPALVAGPCAFFGFLVYEYLSVQHDIHDLERMIGALDWIAVGTTRNS